MKLRAFVNGFFEFLFSRIFLFVIHKANVLKLGQVDATARRLRGGQQEEGVGGKRGDVGGGGGEGGGPK